MNDTKNKKQSNTQPEPTLTDQIEELVSTQDLEPGTEIKIEVRRPGRVRESARETAAEVREGTKTVAQRVASGTGKAARAFSYGTLHAPVEGAKTLKEKMAERHAEAVAEAKVRKASRQAKREARKAKKAECNEADKTETE